MYNLKVEYLKEKVRLAKAEIEAQLTYKLAVVDATLKYEMKKAEKSGKFD